jgi:hypothetical protein
MPAVMAGRRLPDAVHAGDDRAGEHVHDRAARLSGRLSLNSDVTARAADRVVDPVGIGQGAPGQKQGR